MIDFSDKKKLTIQEAAQMNNVTCQAIYVAIKQKKLRAEKVKKKWLVILKDLLEYIDKKYSRENYCYQGERLFDKEKGFYSIHQTASMLNVPAQKIYYATRIKQLPSERKGVAWVIKFENIEKYREMYIKK